MSTSSIQNCFSSLLNEKGGKSDRQFNNDIEIGLSLGDPTVPWEFVAMEDRTAELAKIDEILDRIENLPVLPVVAVRLLEITEDEFSSVKDVAELIESDQTLTAKTLKMANSAV